MSTRYNLFQIEAIFRNYLYAEKVSGVTLKNYCSDLRSFLSWIQYQYHIDTIETEQFTLLFTSGMLNEYRGYLASATTAERSAKRKLSSLRKFFSCCVEQRWLTSNPFKHLSDQDAQKELNSTLTAYKAYLLSANMKTTEIDCQINIVKQFLINY